MADANVRPNPSCGTPVDDIYHMQALKDQGNKAFAAKQWDSAIDLFTQAIALDSSNHVLFSNRSAAKAGKKEWTAALEDAEEVRVSALIPLLDTIVDSCGLQYLDDTSQPDVGQGICA